ncbi:hypothetical protein DSCW_18500 [Desulfosarcina widdelii]|uniref:Uncharacterized protein n=1 Tax=Desulfosarcina widdelii TaxID=947919 RepID=A0A5K7Z2Y7_9BACT|nr:hypothetical protein [Desulfosarcina widdelii]BBO74433.1 hypothetical protein DSCW_18500 [Desulfosarcina widdelii]
MNPIVSVVIETVDLFRDPKNYIPYQRYLLRVGVGSRAYSIQRYKQKKTALEEKSQLSGYRGIQPVIIDTKTGQEVPDEKTDSSAETDRTVV